MTVYPRSALAALALLVAGVVAAVRAADGVVCAWANETGQGDQ